MTPLPPRFLAVHRDGPDVQAVFIGPFVSEEKAREFLDTLPTPRIGGRTYVRSLVHPHSINTADSFEANRQLVTRPLHLVD